MRVLVSAASRHGATLGIGEALARGIGSRGHDAAFRPAEEVDGIGGHEAVVLGSAVYFGHWLDPARELAERHANELRERPVWLFSSGPLGPEGHRLPEGGPVDEDELTELTGARGHRLFAGALDRSKLKLRERAIVRALHAPEGDFRDWDLIDAYAAEIAAALAG
jgi:menaquinone-dependent protoporphyrinogen oxidase